MTADVQLHFRMVPDAFREEPMKRSKFRTNNVSSRGVYHHNLHEGLVHSGREEDLFVVGKGGSGGEGVGGGGGCRVAGSGGAVDVESIGMGEDLRRNKRARRSVSRNRLIVDGVVLPGGGGFGLTNDGYRRAADVEGTCAAAAATAEEPRGVKRKAATSAFDGRGEVMMIGREAAAAATAGTGLPGGFSPPRRLHEMAAVHPEGRQYDGEDGVGDAGEVTPKESKRWKRENLKKEIDRYKSLQARLDDLIRKKQVTTEVFRDEEVGGSGGEGYQWQQHYRQQAAAASSHPPLTVRAENGVSNGHGGGGGREMGKAAPLSLSQQRKAATAAGPPPLMVAGAGFRAAATVPSFPSRELEKTRGSGRVVSSLGEGFEEREAPPAATAAATVPTPASVTKDMRLSSARQQQQAIAAGDGGGGAAANTGSGAILGPNEKRTPKANPVYNNSEFVSGKDKVSAADKAKSKAGGGSKKVSQSKLLTVYEAKKQKIEAVRAKRMADIMKQCAVVLRKIQNQKNSWVFNEPVNWVSLKLHDYPKLIKKPMDLGTVRTKLEGGQYPVPEPFAADVRLVFSNAMTYNQSGSEVHELAKDLLGMFEERYKNVEDKLAEEAIKFRVEEEALAALAGEAKPAPTANTPQRGGAVKSGYLQKIAQQHSSERRVARSTAVAATAAVTTGGGVLGGGGGPRQTVNTKVKPPPPPPPPPPEPPSSPGKRAMTMEEKKRLSQELGQLPCEKLGGIVHILSMRKACMNQGENEIELDIDSLDNGTLWELHRFVSNYTRSRRNVKGRPPGGGGGGDGYQNHALRHRGEEAHYQAHSQQQELEREEEAKSTDIWDTDRQVGVPFPRKQVVEEKVGKVGGSGGSSSQRSSADDARNEGAERVDEDVEIDDDAPTAMFSPVVIEKDDGYEKDGYGSKSSGSSSSSGESGSSSSDSESRSSSGSESEREEAQSSGAGAGFKASLGTPGAEPAGSGADRGPIGSSSPAPKINAVKNRDHMNRDSCLRDGNDNGKKYSIGPPADPAGGTLPVSREVDEAHNVEMDARSPMDIDVLGCSVAEPGEKARVSTASADSLTVQRTLNACQQSPCGEQKPPLAEAGVHDSEEDHVMVQQGVVGRATHDVEPIKAVCFADEIVVQSGKDRGDTVVQSVALEGKLEMPSQDNLQVNRNVASRPAPSSSPAPQVEELSAAATSVVDMPSTPPPPPVTPTASGGPTSTSALAVVTEVAPRVQEPRPAMDVPASQPPASATEEKALSKLEVDHLLASEVARRATMLRGRFAETIIKAREKISQPSLGNAKVEKADPETVKRQQEETQKRHKEEMEQFKAAAKAVEEAKRRAEDEAAAAAKRKREVEREAARKALQTMERTVDIDEQWSVMRAMQELTMENEVVAGAGGLTDKVEGLAKLFVGGDCLEKLGLYRKEEDFDEEEESEKGYGNGTTGGNGAHQSVTARGRERGDLDRKQAHDEINRKHDIRHQKDVEDGEID